MAPIVTETEIQNRLDAIIERYAQLPEMGKCDPVTLEVLNEKGDIKVTISGITHNNISMSAERTILFNESLDFISDTFGYPHIFGRQSKDISQTALRKAYFDYDGFLIVEHTDGSMERFIVKEKNREHIEQRLRVSLGKKFKS